jgi:2'-5' RNA ligase
MKNTDEVIRTFIAVELPKEINEGIKRVQDELKDSMRDVRWTKYGNVHLTVKFLGDTKVAKIDAIGKAIQGIADGFSPFVISLAGIGAFPNSRKPSVVWTGIQKGADEITKIADQIETSMAKFGFPREKRSFKPHLTIGRVREINNPSALQDALENSNVGEIGEFTVDKINLIKSQLDPAGSIYTTLSEALFKTE